METIYFQWKQDNLTEDVEGYDHFWLDDIGGGFVITECIEKILDDEGNVKYAISFNHGKGYDKYDTLSEAMDVLEEVARQEVNNYDENLAVHIRYRENPAKH